MPLDVVRRRDPDAVRKILASVPEWFGIPEVNETYVEDAGRLASYLAADGDDDGAVVGVGLLHEPMNELQRIDWNGPTLILVKPL
jgi:hypothetical protein